MSSGGAAWRLCLLPTNVVNMTNPVPNPQDPAAWAAMMAQMQQVFAGSGSTAPVNWDLARQVATATATNGEQTPSDEQRDEVAESIRLADLWLDEVTDFPSGVQTTKAWSGHEWIAATQPTWQLLCDPIAGRVVEAMTAMIAESEGGEGLPPGLTDSVPPDVLKQLGQLQGMFAGIGGMVFGAQVGQGIGTLSGEVLGATDIGVPLGPEGTAALLPANVTELSDGLERPANEVRLYVCLREAAHHRLYGHVRWLRAHVLAAIEAYARGITVDRAGFEEAFERMQLQVDPESPESLQIALSDGLFAPATNEEQRSVLTRLETALALVEGWVGHVVDAVASKRLPSSAALSETFRRRRAAGGPAEQTFATLVGLQLRPRRLREASALWSVLAERRGSSGRDAIWGHPDLLPTDSDFDDPEGFAAHEPGVQIPGFDELDDGK